MADIAESVVRQFYAAWQAPKLDELIAFFRPDASYIDGPRGEHHGIDAIRAEFERQLAMGFGSMTVEFNTLVSDGRTVMAEMVDTMPVGKPPLTMEIAAVFEVEDGRISRWREYYDLKTTTDRLAAMGIRAPPG